jgi:uncharacterized membrane protein
MGTEPKPRGRDATEGRPDGSRATLLAGPEGRLLLIALALAFVYTLWLGFKVLTDPAESQVLIGMTATTLVFGRAAGLAYAYSLGLGHTKVIPVAIVVETLHVLVFYPLFVFSWRHLLVIKPLKNVFERMHRVAETHKTTIQRYGVVGLFVFVWIPFWMTGSVVGSVIGFLLGLPVWLNMTVVLAGTYAAIVGWAFFLHELHERVAAYDSYAAMALVTFLIVIVLILAGHLLRRTLHESKRKP